MRQIISPILSRWPCVTDNTYCPFPSKAISILPNGGNQILLSHFNFLSFFLLSSQFSSLAYTHTISGNEPIESNKKKNCSSTK